MAKLKNLSEYLQGVCIHFKELQDIAPLPGDEPLPIADYLTYRQDELNDQVIITRYCHGCQEREEEAIKYEEDFIYIADCPESEDPFHKYPSSRICQALILQLRNTYGHEPDGARLYAKYEAGTGGYTVCCSYKTQYPLSVAYAFMLESNVPEKWSPAAKRYLEGGD